MLRRALFWTLLLTCVVLAARVGDRYARTWDMTAAGQHSLDTSAQLALDALPAPLDLIAFVPQLKVQRAEYERLLRPYLAHATDARLQFVDPIAEPTLARQLGVTRHGELHLRSADRSEVVYAPDRTTIDNALNRLALQGQRWIVSLRGHGERPVNAAPDGIGRLAAQFERLGYRVVEIDPRQTEALPDNTALLLVAGPTRTYPVEVADEIRRYLGAGGAAWWLFDGRLPKWIADDTGITPLPGVIVDAAAARYGFERPDNAIVDRFPAGLVGRPPDGYAVLQQARGMTRSDNERWRTVGELASSPLSWNETAGTNGTLRRDPEAGERPGPVPAMIALQQVDAATPARWLLTGGSRWLSNAQIGQADNLALALELLRWLTADQALSAPRTSPALEVRMTPAVTAGLAVGAMIVLPALYLGFGAWLRWRRRRA